MSGTNIFASLVALAVATQGYKITRANEGQPGGNLESIECRKANIEIWHLPYPGDCTRFIKCDLIGNLSTIYTCDKPLHFNPSIQTCDWLHSAGCEGGITTTDPPAIINSTTNITPTPSSSNGYEVMCADATPERWHLPFPGDCTKFIKCDIVGKKWKVYTCDKPLHFNPSIQTCDWPHSAGCEGGITTTDPPAIINSTTNITPTPSSSNGYEILCADATPERWHLPFPGDCTKFIKCDIVGKKWKVYTCDKPLHFNPSIQTCDWPHSAGCEGGITTTDPPAIINSTTNITPTPSSSNGYEVMCADATPERWHLPFPGDCTKFIKCDIVGKKWKVYTCDKPLHFNPSIQTCDWPYSAGCIIFSTTSTSLLDSTTIESCDNKSDSSDSSIDSSDSSGDNSSCDCDKSVDEGNSEETTVKESSTSAPGLCPHSDICKKATLHRWHLPHPKDPAKFYKCDLSNCVAHLFDCQTGLVFRPNIQMCDWP